MNRHKQILICSCLCPLLLSGCGFGPSQSVTEDTVTQTVEQIQYDPAHIKEMAHPVVVLNKDLLLLSASDTPQPITIYRLQENEFPSVFNLFDIKISPSKRYVVWYSATSGMLALDLETQTTSILQPANEWLNKNPFFLFHPNEDTIFFVDDDGTSLYQVSLADDSSKSVAIPFPFGNTFKLAPDLESILFISAFGQTKEKPEFMFTLFDGSKPIRFETTTPLNKRHMAAWLPDSSGVILVGGEGKLIKVSYPSGTIQPYYEDPMGAVIEGLSVIDGLLHYSTEEAWYVIDPITSEKVGQIPLAIAQEIHRPRFIPWHNRTFLIEETLRLDPEQFKRLWISDYIGVKQNLFEKYDEILINSQIESL